MIVRRHARVVALALLCALVAHRAVGAEAGAPAATPWPTAGWESSTPEAQGVSPAALADLVDFGAANDMDSLLVVRHGRIVAEATYAPFGPGLRHAVNSVPKAIVGTLVGIAVDRGTVRLDEPVLASFSERDIAHVDARKRAMTIGDLLDMRSGVEWREPLSDAPPESLLEMERSSDWIDFILDRPMAQPPGQAFNYNSGDWHLLSAILGRRTPTDIEDYARRMLFEPLGIRGARWRRDRQGIPIGGYGVFLEPRDMAKLGYLLLHHGEWAGQQIVSRAWTERVFAASVDMRLGTPLALRYGRGWWVIPDKRVVMAVGFLRQLIIVLPDADVVAVVTGRKNYPLGPLLDRIAAAAASATPLPDDAAGRARLAARIEAGAPDLGSALELRAQRPRPRRDHVRSHGQRPGLRRRNRQRRIHRAAAHRGTDRPRRPVPATRDPRRARARRQGQLARREDVRRRRPHARRWRRAHLRLRLQRQRGRGVVGVEPGPAHRLSRPARRLAAGAHRRALRRCRGCERPIPQPGAERVDARRPRLGRRHAEKAERPTTFEFVVNMRTAKVLGVSMPSAILLRTDRVIERSRRRRRTLRPSGSAARRWAARRSPGRTPSQGSSRRRGPRAGAIR